MRLTGAEGEAGRNEGTTCQACSAVHSARCVGLESGKMMGRSLSVAMCLTTCSVKTLGRGWRCGEGEGGGWGGGRGVVRGEEEAEEENVAF